MHLTPLTSQHSNPLILHDVLQESKQGSTRCDLTVIHLIITLFVHVDWTFNLVATNYASGVAGLKADRNPIDIRSN